MRCHTCNHTLWNVRGRICPECGEHFSPAQYRFRPNTVEFCCAGCGQQYYGTDGEGLLVPRDFTCVTCGAACSMANDMVLRPAPGATEIEINIEDIPWPPREQAGRVSSAFKMLGACLGTPTRVGRALRGSRESGAFSWLVCLAIPVAIGAVLTTLLVMGVFRSIGGGRMRQSELIELGVTSAGAAVGPLVGLLSLATVASALCWFVVRFGDRELSYSTVFSCWCFASAPCVFMAVPCVGAYCGWMVLPVWVPILAGLMLAQCCRAPVSLVVAGVIVPVLAALTAAVACIIAAVALTSTATVAMPPTVQGPPAIEATVEDPSLKPAPDQAPQAEPEP